MGDDIPAEDLDAMNFPKDMQSGNIDNNRISEIGDKIEADQSVSLNTQLQSFYNTKYNAQTEGSQQTALLQNLVDLGYSDERAQTIADMAVGEQIYRHTHDGEPSGLAGNQIEFLRDIGQLGAPRIFSNRDGTQFIMNDRIRNADDMPTRMNLPPPIDFNVLTLSQQEEISQIEDIQKDVILEDTGDEIETGFNNEQSNQISALTQSYLHSDHSRASQLQFRNNIQQIPGLDNIQYIEEYLTGYFNDIENEIEFRENNDGLPQLISQDQYDFLKTNQKAYGYTGQPIYAIPETSSLYFFNLQGRKQIIPTQEEVDIYYTPSEGTKPAINPETIQLPNSLTGGAADEEDRPLGEMLRNPERLVLSPVEDLEIRTIMSDTITGKIKYNDFLNDLDNYDISNQQYFDVVKSVIDNRPTQFNREDLANTNEHLDNLIYLVGQRSPSGDTTRFTILNENDYRTYMSRQGIDDAHVQEDIEGQNSQFRTLHARIISERGQRLGGQEVSRKVLITDLPVIPVEAPEIPNPTGPPTWRLDPDWDEFQATTGPTEEQAIIMPNELSSDGGVATEEEIESYRKYYENNQELYSGFRETYKHIFPVFTGLVGGFYSFSLNRLRNRNIINTFLQEEINLLNDLQGRIDIRLNTVNELNDRAENLINREEFSDRMLRDIQEEFDAGGRRGPRGLQILQDDLTQRSRQLSGIREEITETRDLLNFFDRTNIYDIELRTNINERITRIINNDYTILADIQRYSPQILQGFSIGQTLGYILQGYIFPTYAEDLPDKYTSIEDEPEFESSNPTTDGTTRKQNIDMIKPKITAPPEQIQSGPIHGKKMAVFTSGATPLRANNEGKTLTRSQIEEYKSLLNPDELKTLSKKMLIFGEDGGVNQVNVNNKCKSLYQDTTIYNKRKITK